MFQIIPDMFVTALCTAILIVYRAVLLNHIEVFLNGGKIKRLYYVLGTHYETPDHVY